MKRVHLLTCFIFALTIGQVNAQITNSEINFEAQSVRYWSNADGDDIFSGQDEEVMRVEMYSSSSGWVYGEVCESWSCDAPCYNNDSDNLFGATSYAGFGTYLNFYMLAYESDNSDVCNWYDNDDFAWQDYAALDQSGVITDQSYPGEWGYNWGSGNSTWIFSNSPNFDLEIKTIWRYYAGDNINSTLNFPTLSNNTSAYHANSNYPQPANSLGGFSVGYTNTEEDDSPDVFYSFYLASAANVVVSTDNGDTNFDTFLRLYNSGNQQIAYNDDGGTGSTSVIEMVLCAGTYKIMVEGYDEYVGRFGLEVTTSPVGTLSTSAVSESPTECVNNNGSASISVTGGIPPYTYNWSSGSTSSSASGLGEGTYTVSVTDACGNLLTEQVVISNTDTDGPVMFCNDLTFDLNQGESIEIFATDIDDGSYDDCGIDYFDLSQSFFDASNVGVNTVTLSATDILGYTSSCTANVTVNVNTAVQEIENLRAWAVYPNPTNGQFTVKLETDDLQKEDYISIVDLYGREISRQQAQNGVQVIDISHLTSGVYLVQFRKENAVKSERIVLQR
ncbi:MAG: T9SS type A sorting domain-containing protein [Saprospiraceae bacterium]|nr:T9SS type A sorting domain-containing protein [Saprospiraceae bacterium]